MFGNENINQNMTEIFIINDVNNNKSVKSDLKYGSLRSRIIVKRREIGLERQRNKRYAFLSRRRFHRSGDWSNGSEDGYDSEDSDGSIGSTTTTALNQKELIQCLLLSEPLPHLESALNAVLNEVSALIDRTESEVNIELDDNFFGVMFLNKMSTFIGSQLSQALQIKVVKMLGQLYRNKEVNNDLNANLESSALIASLVHSVQLGDEKLVEQSLLLLNDLIGWSPSNQLLLIALNSDLISTLIRRTDDLKWRTSKLDPESRRQLADKRSVNCEANRNNFSDTSKQLFRHISKTVCQLMSNHLDDWFRNKLLEYLKPLLHKLLACPDPQVNLNVISAINAFIQFNDQNFNAILFSTFGQTLFDFLLYSKNESIVCSVVQIIHKFLEYGLLKVVHSEPKIVPELITHLIYMLSNNVCQLKRNTFDVIFNLIVFIAVNFVSIDIYNPLLFSLLLVFNANDRCIRVRAVRSFEAILIRYSFTQIVSSFEALYLDQLLENLFKMNDPEYQMIAMSFVSNILELIDISDEWTQKHREVRQSLLGPTSNVYNYLEKISHKKSGKLSKRALELIKYIDEQNIDCN